MNALKDSVSVARRYQRSINIREDLGKLEALEGYVFPESAAATLLDFAAQIGRSGQGAFTWTGAYGSGKSSLLVALAALLSSDAKQRKQTKKLYDIEWAEGFWRDLKSADVDTSFVGLVCADAPLEVSIGQALKSQRLIGKNVKLEASAIIRALKKRLNETSDMQRTIIAADELGRALSYTVAHPETLPFFQDLAELANRSGGRLIFIGILHQRFVDYAKNAATGARQNWMKVQGRYSDLAIDVRPEEQLHLLSRAITSTIAAPDDFSGVCTNVAQQLDRSGQKLDAIQTALEDSWPLHPVVTALLGPLSRRSSGQNYRSIFSFLTSAEPYGFQAFLQTAQTEDVFDPMDLWSYIDQNYRGAILSSDYSKNWALSLDTLGRAVALGCSPLELQLIRAITLIDWLRMQSGLESERQLIGLMTAFKDSSAIDKGLANLASKSLLTYREYSNSWRLFEGSDFNVDQAMKKVIHDGHIDVLATSSALLDLPPALAKRHYHDTGTLRWMSLQIVIADKLSQVDLSPDKGSGHFATLLLGLRHTADTEELTLQLDRLSSESGRDVLFASLDISDRSRDILKDISALEQLPSHFPELNGDRIARREIRERLSDLCRIAEADIRRALNELATIDRQGGSDRYAGQNLSQIADQRASLIYPSSPRIVSEILNREKPSASANTALKKLLYAVNEDTGLADAGIKSFPAERGLLEALLVLPGFYIRDGDFHRLASTEEIPTSWKLLWKAALNHIEAADGPVSAKDIYAIWSAPPFGVAHGVLPLAFYIFVRSEWARLAFYRQGLFRAGLNDVDIDYLLKSPEFCELRWLELSGRTRHLLASFGDLALKEGRGSLDEATPLNISRALVAIYDGLPNFAKRTTKISSRGRKLRTVFQKAHDPARLLFEELPSVVDAANDEDATKIADGVRVALIELQSIFPTMVDGLWADLLAGLGAPNTSRAATKEVQSRALKLIGLSDSNTVEAFISRIARYDGSLNARTGVLGLLGGKPTEQWIDGDVQRAKIRLSEYVREFRMLEQYGSVSQVPERKTFAVIVRGDTDSEAKTVRFAPLKSSQHSIEALAEAILETVEASSGLDYDVQMAAIIRASEMLASQHVKKKVNSA